MQIERGVLDIVVYRGDSQVIELSFVNVDDETGNEVVMNLSDIEINSQVRYDFDDSSVWLDMKPRILDAAKGLVQILITASESAALAPPAEAGSPLTGRYDLQFKDKNNPEAVYTPLVGAFRVERDVTR